MNFDKITHYVNIELVAMARTYECTYDNNMSKQQHYEYFMLLYYITIVLYVFAQYAFSNSYLRGWYFVYKISRGDYII